MTASKKTKLTKRSVDAAHPVEKRYALIDAELNGFKLYVHPTGRKSFHLRYRVGGGRDATIREPKIGDHGSITVDAARSIALEWLTEVRKGGDPAADRKDARAASRMSDLFARYLGEHAKPHKKSSSIRQDETNIRNYLRPALGKKKIADVTRNDVAALHKNLADKPYQANRALALLSKMFGLAELWGYRPDGSNPCRHVKKYAETKRKRFLSTAELSALGDALRRAEQGELGAVMPSAIAAIRLLVLTGARKGEILGLQWDWIDFEAGRANLPDSKTGEKTITLGPAALQLLSTLPRIEGNPHVIVGGRKGAALVNLKDPWKLIRSAAGLDDVRIHDLRHSFASVGAASGMSLPVIGALLGHTQAATTQRYAHLSDDPLQAAAGAISDKIAAAMTGEGADVVSMRKQ